MSKPGNKIMIIGSGGSGKSTLARGLGKILALPVVHLDMEFWRPGWVETPKEEWRAKQEQLFSGPAWIADGNYGGSLKGRLDRADTVIFLDFNRWVCIHGIVKRRLSYIRKTRPDIAKGCPEKIRFSFFKWVWQFPSKTRPDILEQIAAYPDMNVIILKNRKAMKRFFAETAAAASPH